VLHVGAKERGTRGHRESSVEVSKSCGHSASVVGGEAVPPEPRFSRIGGCLLSVGRGKNI